MAAVNVHNSFVTFQNSAFQEIEDGKALARHRAVSDFVIIAKTVRYSVEDLIRELKSGVSVQTLLQAVLTKFASGPTAEQSHAGYQAARADR